MGIKMWLLTTGMWYQDGQVPSSSINDSSDELGFQPLPSASYGNTMEHIFSQKALPSSVLTLSPTAIRWSVNGHRLARPKNSDRVRSRNASARLTTPWCQSLPTWRFKCARWNMRMSIATFAILDAMGSSEIDRCLLFRPKSPIQWNQTKLWAGLHWVYSYKGQKLSVEQN